MTRTQDPTARLHLVAEELRRELSSIDGELAATRAFRANGGDDDEHDPDGIPLSSVLEQLAGRRMRTGDRLAEAERAMIDVDLGTYGICRVCSQPIPPARLEVKPTAGTCVRCAG